MLELLVDVLVRVVVLLVFFATIGVDMHLRNFLIRVLLIVHHQMHLLQVTVNYIRRSIIILLFIAMLVHRMIRLRVYSLPIRRHLGLAILASFMPGFL